MKNIVTKLLFFLLGAFIFSISAAFAYSIYANEVGYTPSENVWNVDNVQLALDYLRDGYNDSFYTLEEKQVGEWVDGSPVYQKIIQIPDSTNINNCFSLGISTLNTLIDVDMIWYDTEDKRWYTGTRFYEAVSRDYYSICYEGTTTTSSSFCYSVHPAVTVYWANWVNRTNNKYFIIKYTKSS